MASVFTLSLRKDIMVLSGRGRSDNALTLFKWSVHCIGEGHSILYYLHCGEPAAVMKLACLLGFPDKVRQVKKER